jgi:predicted phosphodiesterase
VHIWGLISDVHGNLPALEEALRVLEGAGADRLAFLGDYLGRGDSDACVRCIRQVGDVAVIGNRDLDWQYRVAPESREWVLSLPRSAVLDDLLVAHGDARLTRRLATSQIARGFDGAWQELAESGAAVWAFGHSHFARTWRKAAAALPAELLPGPIVSVDAGFRYFVNVGTTGLPFPGKGGPSVALVNLGGGTIKHIPLRWQLRK